MRLLISFSQSIGRLAFALCVFQFLICLILDSMITLPIQWIQKKCLPGCKQYKGFCFEFHHMFLRLGLKLNGTSFIRSFPKDFNINDEPTLILINHSSTFDPNVVMCSILAHISFMAKAELFKIWYIRVFLQLGKAISVNREVRNDAIGATKEAEKLLTAGRHVCIFPEGTRNQTNYLNDGRLNPLKMGAFHVAKNASVRIVVLYCDGISRIWGGKNALPRAGNIYVSLIGIVSKEEAATLEARELEKKVGEIFEQGRTCRNDDQILRSPNPFFAILYLLANLFALVWTCKYLFF